MAETGKNIEEKTLTNNKMTKTMAKKRQSNLDKILVLVEIILNSRVVSERRSMYSSTVRFASIGMIVFVNVDSYNQYQAHLFNHQHIPIMTTAKKKVEKIFEKKRKDPNLFRFQSRRWQSIHTSCRANINKGSTGIRQQRAD